VKINDLNEEYQQHCLAKQWWGEVGQADNTIASRKYTNGLLASETIRVSLTWVLIYKPESFRIHSEATWKETTKVPYYSLDQQPQSTASA
jgi:hypothetical protein